MSESDQDFFFDEDEQSVEESESKKRPSKVSSTSKKKSAPAKKAAPASAGEKTVTVTVASLIGVVALLVGVIIGILIPAGGSSIPAPVTNQSGIMAPQLSPEELQGGLPEGHPDIGNMGGGEAPMQTPGTEEATTTE